jgi:hypothetical protein
VADCSAEVAPACSKSQCNPSTGQCEIVPDDGATCDDGLFCTIHDRCQGGTCKGDPADCGLSAVECKAIACDETTRTCHYADQPDGVSCSSKDLCAIGGSCANGQCVPELKSCDFAPSPDACHVAACNPATGACDKSMPGNDSGECVVDFCTVAATCLGGVCGSDTMRDCSGWTNDCNTASCDPKQGCSGVPANSGMACSAGDPCNTGACNATGGCVLTPSGNGAACSDGIACTTTDACSAGKCVGQRAAGGPTVYFSDTFASNAAGWTTEGTWMIGPTRSVNAYPYSNCKPVQDHTQFGDNGVATTNLGGLDGEYVHDFTYLTSPTVDTSGAGSLVLAFSYVIEYPQPPYAAAVIDVFDGSKWNRVWQSQDPPACPLDSNGNPVWQSTSVDISSNKSSAMRVRFGVAAYVAFYNAGWTLDDVAVMSAKCP